MSATSTTRSTQACDACKRRKIKCDGEQACNRCVNLGLKCVYSILNSTSRSRKAIVRGHVIATYRNLPDESNHQEVAVPHVVSSLISHHQSSSDSSSEFPASFIMDLIPDYCTYVLPTIPIITKADFVSAIDRMQYSDSDRALVFCLGAQTLNITRMGQGASPLYNDQITTLYTKALKLRNPILSHDQITVQSIMVALLTSIGFFANHRDLDMGFFYISEAIAAVQVLRVNEEEKMALLEATERRRRERLYWLLCIHERFHSIATSRPPHLLPLQSLPAWEDGLPAGIQEGFYQLIHLFRVIDADFLRNWDDRRSPSFTFAWIEKKQAELADDREVWKEGTKHLSDIQQVDLIVTRYWFRTLLWQMALAKFALTSDDQVERDFMSIAFPLRLSRHLRSLLAGKPREAIDAHGTGILHKIFEITCTIADLLELMVAKTYYFHSHLDSLDDFMFLYNLLMSMSKFYHVERAVLTSKLEAMSSLFPSSSFPRQMENLELEHLPI